MAAASQGTQARSVREDTGHNLSRLLCRHSLSHRERARVRGWKVAFLLLASLILTFSRREKERKRAARQPKKPASALKL
jgi:hypothetical protein